MHDPCPLLVNREAADSGACLLCTILGPDLWFPNVCSELQSNRLCSQSWERFETHQQTTNKFGQNQAFAPVPPLKINHLHRKSWDTVPILFVVHSGFDLRKQT